MKPKKQISLLLLLLIIAGGGYIFSQKNTENQWKNEITWAQKKMEENKAFIATLTGMRGINTSAQYCFMMTDEMSDVQSVECFVPEKFDEYAVANGYTVDNFKKKLEGAKLSWQILKDEEKTSLLQFIDAVAPTLTGTGGDRYFENRKQLMDDLESSAPSEEVLKKGMYLFSLEGDYKKVQEISNKLCSQFNTHCEDQKIEFTLQWKVSDGGWKPVENATIRLLWGEDSNIVTDESGFFRYSVRVFPGQKLRFEATKSGMSLGVHTTTILANANQKQAHDFVLNQANEVYTIDTVGNTVSWRSGTVDAAKKEYIIRTNLTEYRIPFGALLSTDGKKYQGKVTVYLFEFDKSTSLDDLLVNDIFDEVAGYAGNLMKTFGMPFVLFLGENGEKIHVLASNPMVIKNTIAEMEALRTNKDKIYSPLTDEDMKFLVKKSKELGGYPIDRQFLIDNSILRFPAWWVFDQNKGIWVNQGVRVIDEKGIIETPFYTTSAL